MKTLVVGGAGFVGKYLVKYLSEELNYDVVATKMSYEILELPNVTVLDLDILKKEKIIELLDNIRPDYIFHLAAQSSVALSWENPALTVDVNIKGTINLLDAVREINIQPRIILIGSGEEYGHIAVGELPITEENPLRPRNIYAVSKVCQNMIGKVYVEAYDMDIIMVRAFNHTGPNQTSAFVVADFCKQVAEIEAGLKIPILRVGNLGAKRDFTDVRDVVRAYGLLITKGKKGQVYNVGSGKAISIEEVLQMIISKAKIKIEVEIDESKFRPVDVPIIEADTSKLNRCTGWKPRIMLEQTIEETLEFYRNYI